MLRAPCTTIATVVAMILLMKSVPGASQTIESNHGGGPSRLVVSAQDSITVLRQRDPAEGAPASERTTVRVSRRGDLLIVQVAAHDDAPEQIVATQLRRDADLSSDDNVTVLIDSYHDHRSAFLFSTNPYGAMWDAQVTGADVNVDWNGIWDVTTNRSADGWSAEFRIPLRSLRFNSDTNGTFGFNIRRIIRRKNEEALWSGWRRTEGLMQLAAEGELSGVGALTRGRDVELRPFTLAQAVEPSFNVAGERVTHGVPTGKIGADAKLAISTSLTADLTVNTDFAQVEADQQVINLTRFPLFFPEKRDFFLESSGIFDFGNPEVAQLFYSRRIGLVNGSPVPIIGGARVTGRIGGWTLGALDARTGGVDEANDGVVRVRRDVFGRGYVGAIATSRSGPGVNGDQRSGGVDTSIPLVIDGQNVVPNAWVATASTDSGRAPSAWSASLDYPNDLINAFVAVAKVGAGFTPALGFVPQDGILASSGLVDLQPRPNWRGIRQLGFRVLPGWQIVTDEHHSLTDATHWQSGLLVWHPLSVTLQSGDNASFGVQRAMDHPPSPFEIVPGVTLTPRAYWYTRGTFAVATSSARPVSGSASMSFGRFYDGTSETEQASVSLRGSGHLRLTESVTNTSAHLAEGAFDALVAATQFEYAVTTRVNVLGFVQYNNATDRADFNLRLHWIPRIGDDIFVVWNSGYATGEDAAFRFPSLRSAARPLNGALIVKGTHRIAF